MLFLGLRLIMMGKGVLPLILWFGIRRDLGKRVETDIRINVDLASLLGPCGFLNGPWMQVHGGCITGLDAWPFCVGILCEFTACLGSLHWPVGAVC